MKKRFAVIAAAVCVFALFTCIFLPASANEARKPAEISTGSPLEARFLNMLNRNFVYNLDFNDIDAITEDSVVALLDRREADEPDYIREDVVIGFVNDMYGIEIEGVNDNSAMHKDGYVYIAPRGFTAYRHEITDIKENEDGTFTVISDVTVSPHDADEYKTVAETLIAENSNSAFGYSIVYSDIKSAGDNI